MQIKRSDKPTDPTIQWVYNPTPFVICAHFGADRVGGVDVIFQPGDAKKYYEDEDPTTHERVLVPIPNYAAALMTSEEKWGKEGLILVDFENPEVNVGMLVRQALNTCELYWRAYWNTLEQINSFRRQKNEMPLTPEQWLCTDATNRQWHRRPWLTIAQEHLDAIAVQRKKNDAQQLLPTFDKLGEKDELERQQHVQMLEEQQKRAALEKELADKQAEIDQLKQTYGEPVPRRRSLAEELG